MLFTSVIRKYKIIRNKFSTDVQRKQVKINTMLKNEWVQ